MRQMTPAEIAAANDFAAQLEIAIKAAQAAGLPDAGVTSVMCKCIGFCAANGSPDFRLTRSTLEYACATIVATAQQVFAERGAGMQPQGNA